jgi:hypothetical protein
MVSEIVAQVTSGLLVALIGGIATWTLHRLRKDFDQHLKDTRRADRLSRQNADVLEHHGLIEDANVDHLRDGPEAARVRLANKIMQGELDPDELET